MNLRNIKAEKIARVATIATLSFMMVWGLVSVLAEIRPFWVDEWRIIYNLKFKSAAALWGGLDFLQQFPRVYLSVIKAFTSAFGYSYWSLRLPSYLVGAFTIIFCYRLAGRLYKAGNINRFVFVMILISCSTFTEYFVEVKQYTMDMLLGLVVIWQLAELTGLAGAKPGSGKYLMLCTSFLILPFFSYTYPVAIAPVYAVVLIQDIHLLKDKDRTTGMGRILLMQWLPLFICTFSITVFYRIDVSQLMKDSGMHEFWGHLMMDKGFSWRSFFINCYMLFAEIGSGLIYWLFFGIVGIASFLYGMYTCYTNLFKAPKISREALLVLYSTLLLLFVILLFACGKLPLGEPRLNAFTIPSVSILMIYLLDKLSTAEIARNISKGLSIFLLLGLIGNIYTTFIAAVSGPEYTKKMDIYHNTETAITTATARHIPILITPGIAYPYDKTRNLPFTNTVPGDWVLKTFPAYKVNDQVPVYAIDSLSNIGEYMKQLPPGCNTAMAGDGRNYKVVAR